MSTGMRRTRADMSSDDAGAGLTKRQKAYAPEDDWEEVEHAGTSIQGTAPSRLNIDTDAVIGHSDSVTPTTASAFALKHTSQSPEREAHTSGEEGDISDDSMAGSMLADSNSWEKVTLGLRRVPELPGGYASESSFEAAKTATSLRIILSQSGDKLVAQVTGDEADLCGPIKNQLDLISSRCASFTGTTMPLSNPWAGLTAVVESHCAAIDVARQRGTRVAYLRSPDLDDEFCLRVVTTALTP